MSATPTVLTADDVREAHPEIPDGFARSMTEIRLRGGPWQCRGCDGRSLVCYRCSKCGKDLADD